MNARSHVYRCAVRGAWMGAAAGGTSGLLTGFGLCLYLELPIPPLGTAEFGAFLGALLGAVAGGIASTARGRRILVGAALGAAIGGLLMALPGVHWSSPLGVGALGAFLGHQARSRQPGDGWQLRSER